MLRAVAFFVVARGAQAGCESASCALQWDLDASLSTQLLQADSRALHAKKSKTSRLSARHKLRLDMVAKLSAMLHGTRDDDDKYLPYSRDYIEASAWVDASKDVSAEDPQWEKVYSVFAHHIQTCDFDGMQYALLAQWKEYDKYAEKACFFNEGGSSKDDNGIMVDAYYCGSQHLGIDWSNLTKAGYKLADLCNAKVGTAWNSDGICGSLSKKQLLLNFVETTVLWGEQAALINVPSLDCFLDLVDGDIHYCQTCADHCKHKPEHELLLPEP